jgi:sigma-B regulation protein RsbU (phosphoserine phosphatase)
MADRILVVDDEPALELLIRQKFRNQIRSNELAFSFAGDGEEALDQLRDHPDIGIVLTDINMPRMDGLTLLVKLRDLDRTVRAVVVSAYGDLKNIRTAMNRGAFDFVTKPIDFTDLETTIRKSIGDLHVYLEAETAHALLATIQKELDIARRIQETALPKDYPQDPNLDVYGFMIPAREVGGDFFDYFVLDDDNLGFVVADVSGKGVSAAMFMTVSRTLLRALALRESEPAACMTELNRLLFPETVAEMFVTVFYGVINKRTGTITYCNAGHNTPYVVRADGTVEQVPRTGGIGVCLMKYFDYKSATLQLGDGDAVILYTDGVTEAMDDHGEQYSDERLIKTLGESRGFTSNQLIGRVVREVSNFAEGAPQSDDITALAIRYTA